MKQKTIKNEVTLKGVGLHTGKAVTAIIKPAAVNTGIRFHICGKNIPAGNRHARCGVHYSYLQKGRAVVHTVEHLLSALYGMCVSNAVIELSGEEVPFFDGSSLKFSRALFQTGFKSQNKAQKTLKVNKPVILQNGKKLLAAFPSDAFKIFYLLEHAHPLIGLQSFSWSQSSPSAYLQDVAPARTFAMRQEAQKLVQAGLAKGGTMDSAVLIGKEVEKPLRFSNEFARHKCLDLIGDLCFLGMALQARIVALRTGHAENHAFVKRLLFAF